MLFRKRKEGFYADFFIFCSHKHRYEVASKAAADSWSAKNMLVLGIVILGLLFFHLTDRKSVV